MMQSECFDTVISYNNDTFRLTLCERDGEVKVYWNRNGSPVQSGWEKLPAYVKIQAMIEYSA